MSRPPAFTAQRVMFDVSPPSTGDYQEMSREDAQEVRRMREEELWKWMPIARWHALAIGRRAEINGLARRWSPKALLWLNAIRLTGKIEFAEIPLGSIGLTKSETESKRYGPYQMGTGEGKPVKQRLNENVEIEKVGIEQDAKENTTPPLHTKTTQLIDKPVGTAKPNVTAITTVQYARSNEVRTWVLLQADGVCESCCTKAPFVSNDGYPYLEVHHLRRLADGGADAPENTVALCPNCHREMHFGKQAVEKMEDLYKKLSRLEKN